MVNYVLQREQQNLEVILAQLYNLLQWISDKEGIRKSKKDNKHWQLVRPLMYPQMEWQLFFKYKQLHKQRLKAKYYFIFNPCNADHGGDNPESSACLILGLMASNSTIRSVSEELPM